MAARLSPGDIGLQLLENSTATALALGAELLARSTATALALGVLILVFGPVSGAHFNPVVSVAEWWLGRRRRTGPGAAQLAVFVAVQVVGAVAGSELANLMFGLPAVE